jgi:hypothetical protein
MVAQCSEKAPNVFLCVRESFWNLATLPACRVWGTHSILKGTWLINEVSTHAKHHNGLGGGQKAQQVSTH